MHDSLNGNVFLFALAFVELLYGRIQTEVFFLDQIYYYKAFVLIFVLFISNDSVNDEAVKTFIAKEAQERDVVDSGGLGKVATFKGIHLLCFLCFCDNKLMGFE